MRFKIRENIYAGKNSNNAINKRKYKKGAMSPFISLDAGDVDYNVSFFNKINSVGSNSESSSSELSVGESLRIVDEDTINDEIKEVLESKYNYKYIGPVYRFKKLFTILKDPVYTQAKSKQQAVNNIKGKLKKMFDLEYSANLDIDSNRVEQVISNSDYSGVVQNRKNSIEHDEKDYIGKINGKKIYFKDGYYYIDGLDIKFASEEDVKDYLE